MNIPHENPQNDIESLENRRAELEDVARVGKEMELFLNSEAWETALTMVRGEIFTDWSVAMSTAEREALAAEQKALERLREKFKTIDEEGVAAREAIGRINESLQDL